MTARVSAGCGGPRPGNSAPDYVKTALQSKFRVSSINRVEAEIVGDAARIGAEVPPITGGKPVDLSSSGNWNPWPWDRPPQPEPPDPGAGGWGET